MTKPLTDNVHSLSSQDDGMWRDSARIVMVDDEPSTLDILRAFLEDAGYRNVVALTNPRDALRLISQQHVDVLILDLVMPDISGFDILQAMREDSRARHVPVIVLTSFTNPEMKLKALKLGASDFLAKPVDPTELDLRLRNTLATKSYLDRLQLALDNSGLALWDFDLRASVIYLSEQWQAMLGRPAAACVITQQDLEEIVYPDDLVQLFAELRHVREGTVVQFDVEYRVRTQSGAWIWIRAIGKVVERDSQGRALRMTGTNSNITAQKQAEIDLAHQATHDALTGLPNRSLFFDRLQRAMMRAQRNRRLMAVMYMDIDRFKSVNDTIGHDMGDALLKAFANRLAACVRESDTVARMGGDEFTLVVEDLACREHGDAVADKIVAGMRPEFDIDGQSLAITTSLGVAYYDGEDNVACDVLIRKADQALYAAKHAGRNTYRIGT